MKATQILQRQHRVLEDILEKLSKPRTQKPPLLKELVETFSIHLAAKLEQFYPAVRAIDPQQVGESFAELSLAQELLVQLTALDVADAQFHSCVMSVKELIEHRIDADERALFPEVETRLGLARLNELGNAIEARLSRISASARDGSVLAFPKKAA